MSRRTRQVVSTVATVAVLLALWWLQSRSADDEPVQQGRDATSASSVPGDEASSVPGDEQDGEQQDSEQQDSDEDGIPYVDLDRLPEEAAQTVALIDAGGPFPYPGKDGSTFGNFEGELPDRKRGYYAEYTVETPGLSHRGARRIIAGDRGELYWTEDHYASFERIRR